MAAKKEDRQLRFYPHLGEWWGRIVKYELHATKGWRRVPSMQWVKLR